MPDAKKEENGKDEEQKKPLVQLSEKERTRDRKGRSFLDRFITMVAMRYPDLKKRLKQADMNVAPAVFISQMMVQAIVVSAVLLLAFAVILYVSVGTQVPILLILVVYFVLVFFLFNYFLKLPEVKTKKRMSQIDKDLVFAGKQMLIELKAGVPLFDAMLSISKDYGEASKEFNRIVEKISLGVPADVAMHEVAEMNPSPAFRRVILQLINSLRSGSDVASALEVVLDQISREQVIALREYGQKLNPIAMFYMLFGIILPSLGIALAIILASFVNIKLTTNMLWFFAGFLGVMQLIFISIVENSRPKFDM